MQKIQKYHHSVTENGNLQLRIVTEYQDDEGKVLDKKYSDPYTPADTKDMTGFDVGSKAIVAAITDSKVLDDFATEKKEPTGVGLEEIVTYDRTLEDLVRISIRRIIRIFDEGEKVSKKYHRSWIMPGDDPNGKDVISKALALKFHTPEIIATYKSKLTEEIALQ